MFFTTVIKQSAIKIKKISQQIKIHSYYRNPDYNQSSKIAVLLNYTYFQIKKIMPESKSRHAHKHAHVHAHAPAKPTHTEPKPKKGNRAILVAVIFFAFLGLGIGFFINATSILVLLAGAAVGGIAGYFFGDQINKSL